jgi:hypothetical protein
MEKYVVKANSGGKYYTGGLNWGEINNAKKFDHIPFIDSSCKVFEIKPDGKLLEVRR